MNGTLVSATAPFHSAAYASSDMVAEQVAKLRNQEEMIQKQEAMIQQQNEKIQQQNEMFHKLSQKVARLERVTDNDPGGGTTYAKPEEVFKNEIAGIKNIKNDVRGLADEVTTMDGQVANNNLRILVLEERFQYFESNAAKEDGPLTRNNGKMKNRKGK